MATVYLADDLRHRRKVAVKVLRADLAATMGSGRFLHEIEIAAQLQHPHILPLLDSGDADGFLYYVMPFVEGQTLRDRLLREGELPVSAALKILCEVVDALVEAHGKGVIHRDIKPENVLLAGRHALVADFGVAKAVNEATGRHQFTSAGVALGTPAYMAPEQASAEPNLDHRVDLYAVGVMGYEVLTGRPPFAGGTAQQVLAAHLTQAPEPVSKHRASIPPALEAVIMKCLAKRPADRWQTAAELLAVLEPLAATPSGGVTPTHTQPVPAVKEAVGGRRWMLRFGAVAGVVLVAIAAAVLRGRPEARIEFGPVKPVTTDPGLEIHPALSPDGKMLAYAAGPIARLKVYVRSVSGGSPIPVAKDLELNQQWPRWSPDGTRLLLMGGNSIYVVPALGGAPRMLIQQGAYATWSPDGESLAYVVGDTLFARGVDGGTANPLASGEALHSPDWSPDGKLIAFVSANSGYANGRGGLGNQGPSILMTVRAEGGEPAKLTGRKFLNTSPQWLADSRHLIILSSQDAGRDLYSLAVDESGKMRGNPVRLTTGLDVGTFSVSRDGTQLAYTAFPNAVNVWSIPIPSSGVLTEAAATQVTTGNQHIEGVAVSWDGKWLAFASDRQGNLDIYVLPIGGGGGEPRQVTTDPSYDFQPSWSQDGREIVFHSWRNESRDVFVVPATGGEEVLAAGGPAHEYYADWSPDGRSLVFGSDSTGSTEVARVDRGADGRWQVPRHLTSDGGSRPRWSPDGRTIAYLCRAGVCLISPTGGSPRTLLNHENADTSLRASYGSLLWSLDSRTVYLKTTGAAQPVSFWAIPAEGGAPRLLVRFGNPAFSASWFFGTDGKRFYFMVQDYQADIKVMEVRRPR